jgi:hypothetical protein
MIRWLTWNPHRKALVRARPGRPRAQKSETTKYTPDRWLPRGGVYRPFKAGRAFRRTPINCERSTDRQPAGLLGSPLLGRRPGDGHRCLLFRTAQTRTVLPATMLEGQSRLAETSEQSNPGSDVGTVLLPLALETHRRRIWHPPGETANPARTQNVRAPCNSGGNSSLKFHLRGRSTANAAGFAVSTRGTSSLPRSACGLRRPRAPRIRRAGTMMGARCHRGEFREEPNEFL